MRNLNSKWFLPDFPWNSRTYFSDAKSLLTILSSGIFWVKKASTRTKVSLIHFLSLVHANWRFQSNFQRLARFSERLWGGGGARRHRSKRGAIRRLTIERPLWQDLTTGYLRWGNSIGRLFLASSWGREVGHTLTSPSVPAHALKILPHGTFPETPPTQTLESTTDGPDTQPLVRIERVGKIYRDSLQQESVALREVTFSVHPGEVVGLLGLNGAGKTTLLRILATLLGPTTGDVSVAGYRTTVNPVEVRRQIGFVSASTAGYDRMTAREMVLFFGELHGIPRALCESRLYQLFDQLQITPFADRFVAQMSTGMRQKVSIARALIHDPSVLILDEATLGLDVPAAHSLLKTVESLRERGKAVIWSTHVMREVERICDRVVILHHGDVLLHASLTELRAEHPHEALDDLFENLVLNDIHSPHVIGKRVLE